MAKKQLIIICYDFPIKDKTAESNLLSFQLKVLRHIFYKIHIVPTAKLDLNKKIDYRKHVFVTGFRNFRFTSIFYALQYLTILLKEINSIKPRKGFLKSCYKSLIYYLKGIYCYTFINKFINKNNLDKKNLTIYSFWFTEYSLGAILLKIKHPEIKIISGAHGYDLFEERHFGNRIAFRGKSISLVNKVYVCSKEGLDYLKNKYTDYSYKFKLLNTGIKRKKIKINRSNDGKFRILTLSRTHPIKRIKYLIKRLKEIENFSNFEIEYNHIGGGRELESIKKLVENLNFKKNKIKMLGIISDNKLKLFFESSKIDAFLNVSSSEGTSLSLVEAISYSLPVIVTQVGGNESIGKSCGLLLSPNFDAKELHNCFKKIYANSSFRDDLSNKSYKYWSKNHDQEKIKKDIQLLFNNI